MYSPKQDWKDFFLSSRRRKKWQTFLKESMTIAWFSLKSLSNFENQKPWHNFPIFASLPGMMEGQDQ